MNAQELINTARTLAAGDKGLPAMDHSDPTCNKRFARWGIPQKEETWRAYRELIVSTPILDKTAFTEKQPSAMRYRFGGYAEITTNPNGDVS